MPKDRDGIWLRSDHQGGVEVRFAGRGLDTEDRAAAIRSLADPFEHSGLEGAWARQVHSATVLGAVPGCAGTGDALVTPRAGLALAIVTADCVPVLLAAPDAVAAVHAGWRGIAAGVVRAALTRLESRPEVRWKRYLTAWIGPAIGPCCYEVGEEVADRVRRMSGGATVLPGPRGRPHLDLVEAVVSQLDGVADIRRLGGCTRCNPELWSYRRDGQAAGRNLAVIWRRPS